MLGVLIPVLAAGSVSRCGHTKSVSPSQTTLIPSAVSMPPFLSGSSCSIIYHAAIPRVPILLWLFLLLVCILKRLWNCGSIRSDPFSQQPPELYVSSIEAAIKTPEAGVPSWPAEWPLSSVPQGPHEPHCEGPRDERQVSQLFQTGLTL